MREIIFRGKRKDTGEWVVGSLVTNKTGGYYIVTGIHTLYTYTLNTLTCDFSYEVHPETVGQFTGLTDKNGKRIFEGDIVRTRHYIGGNFVEHIINDGVIDFYKGSWRHNREHKQCGWQYWNQIIDYGYEMEIIGNIHDNPELIKEGK